MIPCVQRSLHLKGRRISMSDRLKEMCKSLRLAYVADIYERVPFEDPSQYLEALFQQEFDLRDTAKGERLIKKARFMNNKELDSFQWGDQVKFPPQIDRGDLESLRFISRKEKCHSDRLPRYRQNTYRHWVRTERMPKRI